jgi:hypothetical protein
VYFPSDTITRMQNRVLKNSKYLDKITYFLTLINDFLKMKKLFFMTVLFINAWIGTNQNRNKSNYIFFIIFQIKKAEKVLRICGKVSESHCLVIMSFHATGKECYCFPSLILFWQAWLQTGKEPHINLPNSLYHSLVISMRFQFCFHSTYTFFYSLSFSFGVRIMRFLNYRALPPIQPFSETILHAWRH